MIFLVVPGKRTRYQVCDPNVHDGTLTHNGIMYTLISPTEAVPVVCQRVDMAMWNRYTERSPNTTPMCPSDVNYIESHHADLEAIYTYKVIPEIALQHRLAL
jgi:hypothetical protein